MAEGENDSKAESPDEADLDLTLFELERLPKPTDTSAQKPKTPTDADLAKRNLALLKILRQRRGSGGGQRP